jgi:hypothetical protein
MYDQQLLGKLLGASSNSTTIGRMPASRRALAAFSA